MQTIFGGAQLSLMNPLADGCLFAAFPSKQNRHNFASNLGECSLVGSAAFTDIQKGFGVTTSDINSGLSYPADNNFDQIETEFSFAWWIDIPSFSPWGNIISIPYRNNTTWTAPYAALAVERNNNFNQWSVYGGDSALGGFACRSATTTITGEAFWVFTRSGGTCRYFRNGIELGAHTANTWTASAVPDFSARAPIGVLTENPLTNVYGSAGSLYFTALWDRALEIDEVAALTADPYQILHRNEIQYQLLSGTETRVATINPTVGMTTTMTGRKNATGVLEMSLDLESSLTGTQEKRLNAALGLSVTMTGFKATSAAMTIPLDLENNLETVEEKSARLADIDLAVSVDLTAKAGPKFELAPMAMNLVINLRGGRTPAVEMDIPLGLTTTITGVAYEPPKDIEETLEAVNTLEVVLQGFKGTRRNLSINMETETDLSETFAIQYSDPNPRRTVWVGDDERIIYA